MRMRKSIGGFFCALLLTVTSSMTVYGTEQNTPDPAGNISLYAAAAVLMDADSGRVLYGKNADTPMAMASTTKIMTCIQILEHADLDEMVTVSAYAASMPKVKLYIKQGEQYRVGDLLYSLMLESHNDTAVALAEHVGTHLVSHTQRIGCHGNLFFSGRKYGTEGALHHCSGTGKNYGLLYPGISSKGCFSEYYPDRELQLFRQRKKLFLL